MEATKSNEEKTMKKTNSAVGAILLVVALLVTPTAMAQDESKPEVLVDNLESGWLVAADSKFSEVDGKFAHFLGAYGGWLVNHKLLVGGGAYGKTTDVNRYEMGYGGFVLEYFVNPNRLVNFSVKGLVGGGGVSLLWTDSFFVAEPEAKMTLNIAEWVRLHFGGGYRFVRASRRNDELSSWTVSVGVKFGSF